MLEELLDGDFSEEESKVFKCLFSRHGAYTLDRIEAFGLPYNINLEDSSMPTSTDRLDECSICHATAINPVLTRCNNLYCNTVENRHLF